MTTQKADRISGGDEPLFCLRLALPGCKASAPFDHDDPTNDVCPRWGVLPREISPGSKHSIRDYSDPVSTPTGIYPRTEREQNAFIEQVLNVLKPRVVLISAVSPPSVRARHRRTVTITRPVR
jgi:hypothetical protein